jgi:hypothetical protein
MACVPQPFSAPFQYWVGMNTDPAASASDLADFNHFYSGTHLPEVIAANPGFGAASRYELVAPEARGDVAPRWLAVYELDSDTAVQTYLARNDGPAEGRPKYTPGPAVWSSFQIKWRMMWRQLATYGSASQPPCSIFMVGLKVPPETDANGLAEFNAFYTGTHVPEVVGAGGYSRGIRYELYRELAHPQPGSPRFCAIYEADEAVTNANERYREDPRSRPPRPRFSSGPPAWEQHEIRWMVVYRRLLSD